MVPRKLNPDHRFPDFIIFSSLKNAIIENQIFNLKIWQIRVTQALFFLLLWHVYTQKEKSVGYHKRCCGR
jgi:hypothetical protein